MAAHTWIHEYLHGKDVNQRTYNLVVFNSYLNVLVQAGEDRKARNFIKWLKPRRWNEMLGHTAAKLEIPKADRGITYLRI